MHQLTKYVLGLAGDRTVEFAEGFREKVSGQSVEYHSSQPDVNQALITRATDGTMRIGWKTAALPSSTQKQIRLIWLAGLGVNMGEVPFDLFVNGEKILTFTSQNKPNWRINGRRGAELRFMSVYDDEFGDLFGYMILTLPGDLYPPGKSLLIEVNGQASQSSAWYMTFEHPGLVDQLLKMKDRGFWYRCVLLPKTNTIEISFLSAKKARKIELRDQAELKLEGELQYKEQELTGRVTFRQVKINELRFPLVFYVDGKMIDRFDPSETRKPDFAFFENGLTINRSHSSKNEIKITEASGHFFSAFIDNLKLMNQSYLKNGTVHLISSSHQDIAWMDSPQNCVIQRDTLIITPALKLLKSDKNYRYSAEDALMLREYLERHPDRLKEIRKFSREGRLEWGATYNQPYEGMYYGESLIRQLYLGRRWLKKILPGYDPRVAFNVDVPGRTLQMAQILKKSGVDYMVISRHKRGFFYWQSPDGSKIGIYSPGHYHANSQFLRENTNGIIMRAPGFIADWADVLKTRRLPPHLPVIYSTDMSRPKNFEPFFESWSRLKIYDENRKSKELGAPLFKYDTAQRALDLLFEKNNDLPVIKGERPNVWVYIHGPSHHRALTESGQGARLLPVAETFSALACILEKNWDQYPAERLENAWQNHIYPDHGWGGKNGHITDQVFLNKSRFARREAEEILKTSLEKISGHVKGNKKSAAALIVFNPLAWQRNDAVDFELSFKPSEAFGLELKDEKGQNLQYQITGLARFDDGSIKNIKGRFIAFNVPSVGYRTFFFTTAEKSVASVNSEKEKILTFENDFYRITFAKGGIEQIYDKTLKRDLFRTDKFKIAELFTMKSEGNGAGEFAEVQQPTTEGFDRISNYEAFWEKIADGPVYTRFKLEQEMPRLKVRIIVTAFARLKRIDFDVDLLNWDGTPYREYRLAFPVNSENGKTTYEVPFGKVTVGEDEIPGAAGERYVQPASQVRPREVLDWISVSDGDIGVTFSSSVAVWDYQDPTDDPVDYPILQPLLLASRKSCHREGNWYLQKGDHSFHFSLTSHKGDWKYGYRTAKEANQPLIPVVKKETLP
ncbi:MAG: hypothetical protein GXO77_08555, partial [Calditrichaeota bacterium]|nr:hypothetical protein [Calditrichota bacterium]